MIGCVCHFVGWLLGALPQTLLHRAAPWNPLENIHSQILCAYSLPPNPIATLLDSTVPVHTFHAVCVPETAAAENISGYIKMQQLISHTCCTYSNFRHINSINNNNNNNNTNNKLGFTV